MSLPRTRIAWQDSLSLLAISLAGIFAFWNVPRTFYQQDEWQTLGNNFAMGWHTIFLATTPLGLLFGDGRPLIRALNLIFFDYFRFTVFPIGVLAVLTQVVVAGLFYFLVRRLSGSRVIACVSALLFCVNSVSQQAVAWTAAYGTVLATVFVLFSVFAYLNFIDTREKKYLYYSGAWLFFSLYFKEIGIFLAVLYPVYYLFVTKEISWRKYLSENNIFLAAGAGVVLWRVGNLFLGPKVIGLAAGGTSFPTKLAARMLFYPLTGLFQVVFPSKALYSAAEWFANLQYPYIQTTSSALLVQQSVIVDLLSLAGTAALIAVVLAVWRKIPANQERKHISFALLFSLMSLFPYALVDRGSSLLDSRYYYLTGMGVSMLLGILFYALYRGGTLRKVLAVAILLPLVWAHVSTIRDLAQEQVVLAQEREGILNSFKDRLPAVTGQQVVFYVSGSRDYYIDHNKLPMQQGIGATILAWYYPGSPIPASYLSENILWDMGDQGYFQKDGFSFGYYSDLENLQADYQTYGFSPSNVYGFYWDDKTSTLEDITAKTRDALQSPQ
jgi:hypothetical protein